MTKITRIPKVMAAEVRPPFGLRVTFDNGLTREGDLADELWGPMFEPLTQPSSPRSRSITEPSCGRTVSTSTH